MNDPIPRGTRAAAPNIPRNMRARMAADEARAWNHSPLAGQLWEAGERASRAIARANARAPLDPGQPVLIDIWCCGRSVPAIVSAIGTHCVTVHCTACGGTHSIGRPQIKIA